MPTRTDPWPTGTPCWVDLAVPDVTAAKEFYAAVLGWEFIDSGEEYGHYQMCRRGDRTAAGIGPVQQAGQPSVWTTYLSSDAVDDTAERIAGNGGNLLAEPFDVGSSGRMCLALDPLGAAFGVWQPADVFGVEIYNEPGSLVWNEAALPDADAGRQFYAAVFGYSYQPVQGAPDYTTFHAGGVPLGGIGGMGDRPAGTPPHWIVYFMVDDADTAVATAQQRGATIVGGPTDTPYGRIAMITDPQDATFAIMGVTPG